jgi:hypothetical protein
MYLPPSVILPEIFYTYGNEYYYATNQAFYVGYYHKDKYGNAYTGKTHTNDSQKLNPAFNKSNPTPADLGISTLASTYNVLDSNPQSSIGLSIPPNDSLPPTSDEYNQTYYTRYILEYKLSSQLYIIETNKSTFYEYFNSNFSKYFTFAEVLWKISGPLYDVKENGILMQGGVIDSNLRSISEARKLIPGIENYLTNLTLYYKP